MLETVWPPAGLKDAKQSMNIVIIGDGFAAHQKDLFVSLARKLSIRIQLTPPFSRLRNQITISALWKPSSDASCKLLGDVTDSSRCDWHGQGRNPRNPFGTAFGAHFCHSKRDYDHKFSERSMGGDDAAIQVEIDATPLKDLAYKTIVLANNRNADGGNQGSTSWLSLSGDWLGTAIHELGHALGLADEYDYDGPPSYRGQPHKPNVTTAANRAALLNAATNSDNDDWQTALWVWHELIDAKTPLPSSMPNPSCDRLADSASEEQEVRPGVGPATIGLFEGADYSSCNVYRPRRSCKMRHQDDSFCPVCEWALSKAVSRAKADLKLSDGGGHPIGLWTDIIAYDEPAARSPDVMDHALQRSILYRSTDGEYEVWINGLLKSTSSSVQPLSAQDSMIDALWTGLERCDFDGMPHIAAFSAVLQRFAIYEIATVATAPVLGLRFDTGAGNFPWTHASTFTGRGGPHVIGYDALTGNLGIYSIDSSAGPLALVYGTAQATNRVWEAGYSIIKCLRLGDMPYVLKYQPLTGAVHLQSLDPPGEGLTTFRSTPGHWAHPPTTLLPYTSDNATWFYRSAVGAYRAVDWVFPDGRGIELVYREEAVDMTGAATIVELPKERCIAALEPAKAGVRWMLAR